MSIAGGAGIRRHFSLGRYRLVLTGLIRSRWESHSFPGEGTSPASDDLIPDSAGLEDNSVQVAWKLGKIAPVPLPFAPFPLGYTLEGNLA